MPIWINPGEKLVRITAVDDDAENCDCFELWRLPGRKGLSHDGACLRARVLTARESIHVRIDCNLASGKRFGYVLPENGRVTESLQAIAAVSALYRCAKATQSSATFNRPSRSSVYHFRTLQALDGLSVGASHRDIAAALLGDEAVSTQWSADSALRAHVRSLIQRGHKLLNGGYRKLVDTQATREQGAIE